MSDAVQAEATGQETVDIDWDGVTVTLPAKPDDWDLEALEAFEQGKPATAARGVLGDQYDATVRAYKAKHGRGPKVRDLETLMQAFATAYGFDSAPE